MNTRGEVIVEGGDGHSLIVHHDPPRMIEHDGRDIAIARSSFYDGSSIFRHAGVRFPEPGERYRITIEKL